MVPCLLPLPPSIFNPSNSLLVSVIIINQSLHSLVPSSPEMSASLPHTVANHDTQLVLQSSHIVELVSRLENAITTPRTQKTIWRVIMVNLSDILPANNVM